MPTQTNVLDRKRTDGLLRIAQNTVGTSLATAVPTPALELTKSIGIAAADAWMFYDIYKIYFNERLSAQRLKEMLGNAGIIIFSGGVVSYGAFRVSQSLLNEMFNALPVVGWIASGAITGASSLALGMAWLAYIEAQYRIAYPDAKPKRSEKHVQVQIKTKDEQEDELPEVDLATEDAEPTVEEAIVEEADSTLEAVADVAVTEASTIVEETAAAIINATDDFGLEPDEEGKVYARNPDPEKEGTRVDFDKYAIIRKAILNTMHKVGGEISFKELTNTLKEQLTDFDGSVNWYTTTVKLDLEARGIIERVPDESPQRLRLID
jgi:hypothetical protein